MAPDSSIGPDCLIIDDIDAALASLSELGRAVLDSGTRGVRTRVVEYAYRRRWTILPYDKYVVWAREVMLGQEATWFILDPIFPASALPPSAHRARILRSPNGTYQLKEWVASGRHGPDDMPTAVLDDAAATGGTLIALCRRLVEYGPVPTTFALGVATAGSRRRLARTYPSTRIASFQRGDWNICHLRDGCAHLPFTGRLCAQPDIARSGQPSIEVRLSMASATNNLWQVLLLDRAIREAVAHARVSAEQRLSDHFGRQATVADLALLGPGAPAIIDANPDVNAETALATLL